MLDIVCIIALAFKLGDVAILHNEVVEGKLLYEDQYSYLVDFRKGIQKKQIVLADSLEDYAKVIVLKNKCVREKK